MSIEVKDLVKKYGAQRAVDGISFSIPSGQVVGFLGPNGAGKSTTMKILTCYQPQTDGHASVCGLDTTTDALNVRRKIGYLPEHNPLYLEMYVREFLLFTARLNGLGKNASQKVEEMIELTGLTVEQNKKIGALSKGYRQRVGLAQALIHDPEVLILDEPTSGLDPNQITEIRNLIRKIGKDRTVLLSTHIMQEVEAMCDRVIIIHKGRIVADDTTEGLQKRFKKKQQLRVTFKSEIKENELRKIKGIQDVKKIEGFQYRLFADNDMDLKEAVFNFAVSTGNVILEQQEETYRLEDVFRELTIADA